ncbi:MAG: DUF2285 domain-containing protein [Pseudomonadota bacterium]
MTIKVEVTPPTSDHFTNYDQAHLTLFLRLLDADQQGVHWTEAARIIFGSDAQSDHKTLHAQHSAHLKRAKWLVTSGYLHLAASPPT